MPLTNKVPTLAVIFILLSCFLSGCQLGGIFGGTEFILKEFEIVDYDGFPALNLGFSCSDTVTVKIFDKNSKLIDSDYFFKGDHEKYLLLGQYYQTISQGTYKIQAYDGNNNNIYSKSINVDGADISVLSVSQFWWKKTGFGEDYNLIGLNISIQNDGDVPFYPYEVDVYIDSKIVSGRVLTDTILSEENKNIFAIVYKENTPASNSFNLDIRDIEENIIVTGSYEFKIVENVNKKVFKWNYKGSNAIELPRYDYLYTYYIGLDRAKIEDYSSYVFDSFDEQFIEILRSAILSEGQFNKDVDKINFVTSFVQHLEYMEDNTELDYPRYPIETVFNNGGGGDCEDKAILTASILSNMDYNISLFRLPDHMAVGVNLSEDDIPDFDFYSDGYYFLETTTERNPCGFVPNEYKDLTSEVIVYPITSRPLLDHTWEDEVITIFKNTEKGNIVKVTVFVENLGGGTAEDFIVEAGFFTLSGYKSLYKQSTVNTLEAGLKKKVSFTVNIPKGIITTFKTRIILDGQVVDERESLDTFGT